MRRGILPIITALAVTIPTIGYSVSIEEAIEARRAYKQLVLHNSRELFAMAMGEAEYDPGRALTFARNLKSLTRMKNASLWPEGSDWEANRGKTRALSAAWESDAILERHAAFRHATGELAGVADKGLEALREKIGDLETICRDCHQTFRARDF